MLPPKGFPGATDEQSSVPLPDCCEHHKQVFKDVEGWFRKFPNCCKYHKRLLKASWFDKKHYEDVVMKVVRQVAYTEYHILESIDTVSWYDDITDYILANFFSFGQFTKGYGNPVGAEKYMYWIELFLRDKDLRYVKGVTLSKLEKLVGFIESRSYKKEDGGKIRINHLYLTYKKWLDIFPFSLKYFKEEYVFFVNTPALLKEFRYNKYLKEDLPVMHTEISLINSLVYITKLLLKRSHPEKLVEKGVLPEVYKHQLTIINENHRIKQSALIGDFSKKEGKYIKLLNEWLENEKMYFDEVLPLMSSMQNSGTSVNNCEASIGRKDLMPSVTHDEFLAKGEDGVEEKTLLECLSGMPKFYEGAAKRLSKYKLAICYLFLEQANMIVDRTNTGGKYGKSFQTYSPETDELNENFSKLHKNAYHNAVKLVNRAKLTKVQIRLLEDVWQALDQYPSAQKFLRSFIKSRK
ncbi:hypothetical protein D770_10075 [Flammeovirgaceae bacterium 311]|nr:hypothetical protein D770_10075 [Flammeovirgaceae bacterium 311]